MALDRIKQLSSHLTGAPKGGVDALLVKNPDDIVITMAIRSPLCKAKKGGLKDTRTDELMLEMFKVTIIHYLSHNPISIINNNNDHHYNVI
jgi:acetyl-CoA acyltransferase 1